MASSSPGPARWRGGKPALPGHPSQLVATSEPLLNGGGVVWQAAAAPNGAEHQFAPANNGGSWGTSGAPAAGSIEHAADKQWSVAGDGAGGQPYFAPVQRRSAGATYVDGQLQPPLYGDGSTLGQPVQQYSEAQYVPASLGGQAVHRQLAAIAGHQAGTGYGDAAAQYSSGDEEKGSARLAAARRPVTPVTPATLRRNSRLAMLSMLLLVFQGTALSIMLRYSRARAGTPYLASVSVILTEVIKLLICLVMQFKVVAGEVAAGTAGKPSPPPGGSSSSMGSAHSSGGSATSLFGGAGQAGSQGALAREVRRQARDIATKSLPMLLPAGMFVMQQVLLVIAATHLDAVAFQIFSQSFKLVPTALFAYWLLGQMLEPMQWASIPVLAFGVILVTVNNGGGSAKSAAAAAVSSSSHGLDYVAGMVACSISGLSSAYAGVYFEKYVKGKHAASLWVRNIQLGIYGVPLSTLYALVKDGRRIYTGGLLQGFDSATWMVIALQVFGGLVTGMVVKYCDNILKNFALAISVILTVLVAIPLFGQWPSPIFLLGVALVLLSVFMYGRALDSRKLALYWQKARRRFLPAGSTHRSRRALVFALLAGCVGLLLLTGALTGRQATGTRAITQQGGMGRRGIGRLRPDDVAGGKVQRIAAVAAHDAAATGGAHAARGGAQHEQQQLRAAGQHLGGGQQHAGGQHLAGKQQHTGVKQALGHSQAQQREGATHIRQQESQQQAGRITEP